MDDFWDELLGTWWGKILMAIAMLGAAWAAYAALSGMENGAEGNVRVPWYVALAYYVGGKWVVAGFLAFIGTVLAITGIRQALAGEE